MATDPIAEGLVGDVHDPRKHVAAVAPAVASVEPNGSQSRWGWGVGAWKVGTREKGRSCGCWL